MNASPYARMAGIAAGAATIFGLQQGLEMSLWIALPLGVLAYAAALIGVGFLLAARAK